MLLVCVRAVAASSDVVIDVMNVFALHSCCDYFCVILLVFASVAITDVVIAARSK